MNCPKCNEDIMSMSVHYCSSERKTLVPSDETACSLLCEPGYYVVKWGFTLQMMRIRRRVAGFVKHNYGWTTEKEWLGRNPSKIEHPTLWDRVSNFI